MKIKPDYVELPEQLKDNKLLNPEIVKNNLLFSSLYLLAYELLKNTLVDRIKSLYSYNRIEKDGHFVFEEVEESEKYKEIIRKGKNRIDASLNWFIENNVISENDKVKIESFKMQRDLIAHNFIELMADDNKNLDVSLFFELNKMLDKIERWWVINIDMTSDEAFDDFDYETLDEKEVLSGNMAVLNWVISCALDLEKDRNGK
jgi:hypothetical protein